jgi:hypothetical protein
MSGYSANLDDAGHPSDKPYVAVGGFIASEEQWIAFEEPWKQIMRLRKLKFPFHATDFFHEHRKDNKLKHIVSDLVRVITNHIEAAFSVTVDMTAYKDLNRVRRVEEFLGTPYALVTRALHDNVDKWQKLVGPRSPLLYFVESGTLHRGDMEEIFRDRDGIAPPVPVDKDHVCCQAADLYAHAIYQTACAGGLPSLAFSAFMEKLPYINRRMDARIFREELESDMQKKMVVVTTPNHPEGVRVAIPPRELTKHIDFNFKGNLKRFRRGTVGLPTKKKKK